MEENMNTLVANEAVDEVSEVVADAIPANNSGWKTAAKVGGTMVLGAVLWEKAVKPIGRKVKSALVKAKQKKAAKAPKTEEVPLEDMKLDDDYEIPD